MIRSIIKQSRRCWVIVTIDTQANQCTTPNHDNGTFFCRGIGASSIATVAKYASHHGYSYPTHAVAQAEIDDE